MPNRTSPRFLPVVLLVLLFTLLAPLGWAAAFVQEQPHATSPKPQADEADASRFLRFEPDPTGGGTLQTSIVRYANDKGVTVDLIGAVHVADRAYYELLNERFKQYDSLLYEMVKPADTELGAAEPGGGLNLIHMLQKAMQTVLELDYQLEGIDYRAENFVHADMDLETFMRRQSERGEGFLQLMLRQMLRDMTRPPDPNYQPPNLLEIMEAMGAPDRARRLKLLFARELTRMDDMLEMFSGEDGKSVILDERNEAAIEVLDERIEAGDRKLGVFYGAAHLKGMEQMLRQRGFHPVGEPEWLIAWDMTLDGSGKQRMREQVRQAIVAEAVENGQVEGVVATAGSRQLRSLRDELAALRAELAAMRKENEALREQVETLREQNTALRDRSE